MFPLNPWGRRRSTFALTLPRLDAMLAAYRLGFAVVLFQLGLQLLLWLALAVCLAVGRNGTVGDGWVVLACGALFLPLYLWLTWRFLRKSWFALRAYRTL